MSETNKKERTAYSPEEIIKPAENHAEKKKRRILATPIVMNPGEAMAQARKCGNSIGKALYGKEKITLKLLYLESREIILNLYYQPAPIMKLFGKKPPTEPSQKIRMVVEGTRGGASYAEEPIRLEEIEVVEDALQKTDMSDDVVFTRAKNSATRMVRRRVGKIVTADLYKMRPFYRPYYVAFYGEMQMGKKVRYITIAADGNEVNRTF